MIEQEKSLSYNIKRGEHNAMMWSNKYTYEFWSPQYLEKIDDLSSMSSFTYNEIKQMHIDTLVSQFRISLNSVIFGDPVGKDYVEALENEKKK